MKVEMELQIKFNREVDLNKDYIVPGGYKMVMNGRNVHFDFCQSHFGISRYDSSVCIFSLDGADYDSFPEFEKVTVEDLQNITSIKECFVYLGEAGESDLEVVSIKSITFILPFEEPAVIDVSEEVIKAYNATVADEKKEKKGVREIKLPSSELKEKIMAQQLVFYSRFLDIPLETLCGYTIKQLESMVDCTLEQMPEDVLMEFEIELNGGKKES